jgi:hypothetical protein
MTHQTNISENTNLNDRPLHSTRFIYKRMSRGYISQSANISPEHFWSRNDLTITYRSQVMFNYLI